MVYTFAFLLYVLVSVLLILVVLLQASKGGGLAGVLGGTSAFGSSLFGGRGAADFLTKTTAALAVLFVLFCLALNALTPSSSEEVRSATLREMERQAAQKSPAAALPTSKVQPVIPESEGGTETSE